MKQSGFTIIRVTYYTCSKKSRETSDNQHCDVVPSRVPQPMLTDPGLAGLSMSGSGVVGAPGGSSDSDSRNNKCLPQTQLTQHTNSISAKWNTSGKHLFEKNKYKIVQVAPNINTSNIIKHHWYDCAFNVIPLGTTIASPFQPSEAVWWGDASDTFNAPGAIQERQLAMDQYLLIPFLGGWTSINPSYFDMNYRGTIGFDTLPTLEIQKHLLTNKECASKSIQIFYGMFVFVQNSSTDLNEQQLDPKISKLHPVATAY